DGVVHAVTKKWSAAADRVWRRKGVSTRSRRRQRDEEEGSREGRGAPYGQREYTRISADGVVRVPEPVLRLSLATQLLVATSRNVGPKSLNNLAGSYDAVVRLAVAAHPITDIYTRERLAGDT